MRLNKLGAILLFVAFLLLPIFAFTKVAHADLTYGATQDSVRQTRRFFYEVMDVKSGNSTVQKISIYTIRCNYDDGVKTCDPNRDVAERWIVNQAPQEIVNSTVLRFTPVNPDTGTRAEGEYSLEPELVVSRSDLSNATVAIPGKTITTNVNDVPKAEAFLKIDSTGGGDKASDGVTPPTVTPDAETENTEDNSCEQQDSVMGWIFCPVIFIIDGAINWTDSRIQELLNIDKGYYDNEGVRNAWVSIRNIAYIILLPIMLVMVIGTALGFELISAYTVKKALPRMIAAVIFISLSYEFCVFMIELFDSIGKGTLGILTSPFAPFEKTNGEVITVSKLTLSSLFGPGILTSLAGAAVGAIGILLILWLFGGTLLLFVGTAFLVLLLRQIFIVAFLLLAPLAILAWIFPGNDKLFKIWWGSFSKLLMMFPLIMGIIAVGRIFAFIIHSSNPAGLDGAVLAPLMTLVAYVIPYAFIPFTFKLAGGVFATITGMVNDGQKGLFDRQKQTRAAKLKRAQDNHAFNERRPGWRGKIAKRANTIASIGTSNPWTTANIYGFGTGRPTAKGRDVLSQITAAKLDQTRKMSEALKASGVSIDKGLAAIAGVGEVYDKSGRKIAIGPIRNQSELDNAISLMSNAYDANGNEDHQTRTAATQLRNASNFILSAHTNEEYGRGSLAGAALMEWSQQGFASKDDIVNVANAIGSETGDQTLGNLIGSEASYLGYSKGNRLELKPTYGVVASADGGTQALTVQRDASGNVLQTPQNLEALRRQKELVKGLKQYEWNSAKGQTVKDLSAAVESVITEGGDVGGTMAQTVAANAMSSTDPGSKAEWRKIATKAFAAELSSGRDLDSILYEKAYGRGGQGIDAERILTGPGGPAPGPPSPGA